MKKIKLLVIDDNINLIRLLKEYFSTSEKVELVYECYNGSDGLKYIIKNLNSIDVILLDLIMPKKDGMYVLNEIRKKSLDKKIIVETSYNSQEIIDEVANLNIEYFILKPFELKKLEETIINVATNNIKHSNIVETESVDLEEITTNILKELGIPAHIKGYQYIRDSILLIIEKKEYIGGITKELYPEIANIHETTVSRVERSIRHAIEVCCDRVDTEILHKYFGYSLSYEKSKPTNSEFLVTIADTIKVKVRKAS